MNEIKAVIFDMDGVLIDAKEWHYEALNRALLLFGLEISRYDHIVTYDGLPTRKKLEMMTLECGLPRDLHKFISKMKQIYTTEFVYLKCKPYFPHQYALSKLHNEGYKLAVCSNAIRASVKLMLEKAGLMEFLDFVISNEDVKAPKPDPEMYDTAIRKLGLTPAEALILEDNENGLKAAYGSGAHVMRINSVVDTNYYGIKDRIKNIEGVSC